MTDQALNERFYFTISPADHAAGLDVLRRRLPRPDPRYGWWMLALAVAIVAGISNFRADALGVVLIASAALTLGDRAIRLMLARHTKDVSYDLSVSEAEVEVTDAHIIERTPVRERQWTWQGVQALHDRGSVLVFELAGWDFIIIPSSAWPTEGEKLAFCNRLPVALAADEPEQAQISPFLSILLQFGAIAAALDFILIVSSSAIWLAGRLSGLSPVAAVVLMLAPQVGSLLLSVLAYRIARSDLRKLAANSPVLAEIFALGLIWVFPVFGLAIAYGWL